jgi:hypothetical protein
MTTIIIIIETPINNLSLFLLIERDKNLYSFLLLTDFSTCEGADVSTVGNGLTVEKEFLNQKKNLK